MLGNVLPRGLGLTGHRVVTKVLEHLQERLFSRAWVLSYFLGDFIFTCIQYPLCSVCFDSNQRLLWWLIRGWHYPHKGVLWTPSGGEPLRTQAGWKKTATPCTFPVPPHPVSHCLSGFSFLAQCHFEFVPQSGAKHCLIHSAHFRIWKKFLCNKCFHLGSPSRMEPLLK